jgi:hypothetical protein
MQANMVRLPSNRWNTLKWEHGGFSGHYRMRSQIITSFHAPVGCIPLIVSCSPESVLPAFSRVCPRKMFPHLFAAMPWLFAWNRCSGWKISVIAVGERDAHLVYNLSRFEFGGSHSRAIVGRETCSPDEYPYGFARSIVRAFQVKKWQ